MSSSANPSTAEKHGSLKKDFLFGVLGKTALFGAGNLLLNSAFGPLSAAGRIADLGVSALLGYGAAAAEKRSKAERVSVETGEPLRKQRIANMARYIGGSAVTYGSYLMIVGGIAAVSVATAPAIIGGGALIGGSLYAFYKGYDLIDDSIAIDEQTEPTETVGQRFKNAFQTAGEKFRHLLHGNQPQPAPETA